MTYFILDTNIVIRDPEILARWSPNYKIVIPKFLFAELDRVSTKLGGAVGRLWQILEQAEYKDFIIVDNSEVTVSEEAFQLNTEQKLSYVDLQLFEIAKQYKSQKKDVVLVSNDRALRVYSERQGLKTFDLFQFLNFTNSFKTTALDELKKNETILQYQNRRFVYGLLSGIVITILTILVKNNFQRIYETLNVWGTLFLLFTSGIIFFLFRTNYRMFYGTLEFLFGFYVSTRVFTEKHFDYTTIGLVEVIQIVGGIYVMVRGLSNIDDGIKGTRLEPKWKKITRWRKIGSA
ncbi:MAG: PIN domain-containing protein [Chitinophagaceae bacterium]